MEQAKGPDGASLHAFAIRGERATQARGCAEKQSPRLLGHQQCCLSLGRTERSGFVLTASEPLLHTYLGLLGLQNC